MPVSASIYDAIGRGVQPVDDPQNALLKALKLQGAQQELQTGSMKMDEYRRGVERNNKLQQLLSGDYADDESRAGALVKGGFLDEGQKVLKNRADLNKQNTDLDAKRLEMASKRLELAGQGFGWLKDNPSPENAIYVIDSFGQNGIWSPQQVAKAKADVMANPTPENVARLATMGYQSALSAKDQLPSFVQQGRGGTVATQRINPVTGKVDDVQSATVTQTEAQRLQLAQQADEAAKNRGVQIRGQNLIDARARDANLINKELAGQKTALEIQALQDKATERDKSKQAAVSSVESQIRVIDKALAHPGMKTATGLSGTIDPRNYVAGTDATDFRVVLDQIGGAAFLQAFESLKGGGAITEVEGKKATDAIARLNRAQSDSEFETSLNELRGVMETGYKRMAGKDYQRPNAPAKPAGGQPARITGDADYNALPSGATFVGPDGKTRRKP